MKKHIAFLQIDEKEFYDLIAKEHHSYPVGTKRPDGAKRLSLRSARLLAEDSLLL